MTLAVLGPLDVIAIVAAVSCAVGVLIGRGEMLLLRRIATRRRGPGYSRRRSLTGRWS